MASWWASSRWAWIVENFRAMTWRYKLLYSGVLAAPVLLSFSAYLQQHETEDSFGSGNAFFAGYWRIYAEFFWLALALILVNHVRGYLALQRGVLPTPPKKAPPMTQMWLLVMEGLLVCLFASLAFLIALHHKRYQSELSMALFWLAMFLVSLHGFVGARGLAHRAPTLMEIAD